MTQEEKSILLVDLCARLPYEPAYDCMYGSASIGTHRYLTPLDLHDILECDWLDGVRLYLRPMSSMTKEEKDEVSKLGVCYDGAFHNDVYDVGIGMEEAFAAISWLLERHFDINYLIHKGLALEAPEGMYDIKNS